jgi:hypothetical protein
VTGLPSSAVLRHQRARNVPEAARSLGGLGWNVTDHSIERMGSAPSFSTSMRAPRANGIGKWQ